MLAFKIVRHSVLLVLRNFSLVIKIFWPLAFFSVALPVPIGFWIGFQISSGEMKQVPVFLWVLLITLFLGATIATASSAVKWHRYVLLNELPKLWREGHARRVLNYAWGSIWILFALMIIAMAGVIFHVLIIQNIVNALTPSLALRIGLLFLTTFCTYVFIAVIGIRYAAALPGVSVEQLKKVRDHWHETNGQNGMIALVVVMLLAVFFMAGIPGTLIDFLHPTLGVGIVMHVIALGLQVIFTTAVQLSVITIFYGYFFEKRELF